jgi:squalene cyclase
VHGPEEHLLDADHRRGIEEGLDFLAKIQNKSGAWGHEKGSEPSGAVTGLAGLAALAGGRDQNAERAAAWLEKAQSPEGAFFKEFDSTGIGVQFEQVAATLFGTESRRAGRAWISDASLQKAIDRICADQKPDGGWGHSTESDLATTAMIHRVLESARAAGLVVADGAVERLVRFVESRALVDGGFRGYHGMFYPTSAGLMVLGAEGRGEAEQLRKSSEKVGAHRIGSEYGGLTSDWCSLAMFMATHALMFEGGKLWEAWFPYVRDFLFKKQNPDGSWTIEYCMNARGYATSLALLVLQAPLATLPMFRERP